PADRGAGRGVPQPCLALTLDVRDALAAPGEEPRAVAAQGCAGDSRVLRHRRTDRLAVAGVPDARLSLTLRTAPRDDAAVVGGEQTADDFAGQGPRRDPRGAGARGAE